MLLDTCVVSELIRPAPEPSVVAWVKAADDEQLYLSVLSLGEIRKGTHRLPAGPKRKKLEAWAERLRSEFSKRILPIDDGIALLWGELTAEARRKGFVLTAIDGLLAATAINHRMPLVTRNVDDFSAVAVEIINPWR
jgi:predicted nucleic acid-binding protein